MYHVLMPIDENEDRATTQARAVTDTPGAGETTVTLLYVVDGAESAAGTDLRETAAGEAAAELLEGAGVTVETAVRSGDAAEEILGAADDLDVDAVVLGGRKRSPLGSLLFGSVSQAVTLDANRPVTVTGAEARERPTHRCQSCGETYYTDPSTEIETCRRCGGTKVERVREEVEA